MERPDEKTVPDEQTSVRLIKALARIWTKIRARHAGVPAVVLLAAPAPRDRLNVLGHFAALRWRRRQQQDHHLHEVVVVAEHLNREAEAIVETLLHEAAHALNFERGIRDCTASQYHNRTFAGAARELGLDVQQVRHYGFAMTRLAEGTAALYKEEIDHLREVLVHRQRSVALPGGTGPPPDDDAKDPDDDKLRSRSRKATCQCGYIIRVSKKTIEATVIRCDTCGEPFQLR